MANNHIRARINALKELIGSEIRKREDASEEHDNFNSLLDRLDSLLGIIDRMENNQREIEFEKINNEYKTLVDHTDLADIDALKKNENSSETLGDSSSQEENDKLYKELKIVSHLINRGNDEKDIKYYNQAQEILGKLVRNGVSEERIASQRKSLEELRQNINNLSKVDSSSQYEEKKLMELLDKINKEKSFVKALEIQKKADSLTQGILAKEVASENRKKAIDLLREITSITNEKSKVLDENLNNLFKLMNDARNANDYEQIKDIEKEANLIFNKYFIKDVPDYMKNIANERVDFISNRAKELDKKNGINQIEEDVKVTFGSPENPRHKVPQIPKTNEFIEKQSVDKVKITIYNGKHQETFLIPRGTKIKEPLPAIPVNESGKPKKITAKEFTGWENAYGEKPEFPVEIDHDFELYATYYRFDKKKALAVGLGAGMGVLAYIADLALPTPVPVISTVGSIGFKIGSSIVNKNLANIQNFTNEARRFDAQKIQNLQEPSPVLQTLLETEKSLGYLKTFLNTAAIACGISAAAHGIKNAMDAKTQIIEEPVQPETIVNEPIVQEPIIQPEPQQLLGEFDPTIGKVYKTANSALSGTGAGNPYMPAYQGEKIYEAFFNGQSFRIKPGQTIESILRDLGASDISEVAVNVMNSNGTPLTWQPLEALVEGISQVR